MVQRWLTEILRWLLFFLQQFDHAFTMISSIPSTFLLISVQLRSDTAFSPIIPDSHERRPRLPVFTRSSCVNRLNPPSDFWPKFTFPISHHPSKHPSCNSVCCGWMRRIQWNDPERSGWTRRVRVEDSMDDEK